MNRIRIETGRLILKEFEESDLEAVCLLLSDKEVNTFLPWYPVKDRAEAREFYEKQFKQKRYCFAVCPKGQKDPVGYIRKAEDDSHELGYALRKEYWRQGLVTEAGTAVIRLLKEEGIPYITATHDRNNPRSGAVLKRLGMKYCYSYQELWQPKGIPVLFRMYQLNLDGQEHEVYQKYWNLHEEHFIETGL